MSLFGGGNRAATAPNATTEAVAHATRHSDMTDRRAAAMAADGVTEADLTSGAWETKFDQAAGRRANA